MKTPTPPSEFWLLIAEIPIEFIFIAIGILGIYIAKMIYQNYKERQNG